MKLIIIIILLIIVFIIYMKKENYTNEGIQMLESIYKDGDVLSEKKINFTKNFLLKYGVIFPSGTILPYFSKYIPTNWKLCDGTNGTPDLRNKYLLGSSSPEDSGGNFEKVIHKIHMPSHQHIVKIRKEGWSPYYPDDGGHRPRPWDPAEDERREREEQAKRERERKEREKKERERKEREERERREREERERKEREERERKEREIHEEISLYTNPLKYFNNNDKYKFYTSSGKSSVEKIYLKPPSVTLNYIIKI